MSSTGPLASADFFAPAGLDWAAGPPPPALGPTTSTSAPTTPAVEAEAVGDAHSGDEEEEIVAPALLPTPGFLGGAEPSSAPTPLVGHSDVGVQTEAYVQ